MTFFKHLKFPNSIFLLLCLSTTPAYAGIVWENGASNPDNTGAHFSQRNYRVADDFTLSEENTLRSVTFWGTHWKTGDSPAIENFTAYLYSDDNNNVGDEIANTSLKLFSKVDTGFEHNYQEGASIFEYTMDFSNSIDLLSGDYWLSIVSFNNPVTLFLWQETNETNSPGNKKTSNDDGQTWANFNSELAFSLSTDFNFPQAPQPAVFNIMSAPSPAPIAVPEPNGMIFIMLVTLILVTRRYLKQ